MALLLKRTTQASDKTDKTKAAIVAGSVGAALLFAIILFFVLRSLRYPASARQALGRPRSQKPRRSWLRSIISPFTGRRQNNQSRATNQSEMTQDPEAGVDRHTSVRSVATLPAYSAVPRENEGILGREGDRAGMDTVVEFPETNEEEENRRQEEMASLWRIRQERTREAAARESRRERRREARARGDTDALNALRHETMLRATLERANGSHVLIAEHNSKPRERRTSAVAYGDLGVARHDGTRVRENSIESDSRPLLDSMANTGIAGPIRPWVSRSTFSTHHRMPSASSVLTTDSVDSDRDGSEFEVIPLQHHSSRPRAHSRAQSINLSLRRPSTQTPLIDGDLGHAQIPLPDPPHYDAVGFEEAPPYDHLSPITPPRNQDYEAQPPRRVAETPSPIYLPEITRLPSIRINEPMLHDSHPIPTRASTIDEETT